MRRSQSNWHSIAQSNIIKVYLSFGGYILFINEPIIKLFYPNFHGIKYQLLLNFQLSIASFFG